MVKNLILSIIALAILAGCSGKKDKTTEETVEAVPVKVQKLEKTNIAKTLDYTANLQADKQVYYAPAATGRIEKIYVEVGDRIKKGQLLVEMDRTQLVQAEVQLKNLETEYNKNSELNQCLYTYFKQQKTPGLNGVFCTFYFSGFPKASLPDKLHQFFVFAA